MPTGIVSRSAPICGPFSLNRGPGGVEEHLRALSYAIDPMTSSQTAQAITGMDITLQSALPVAPNSELVDRWSNHFLDDEVIPPFRELADEILAARALDCDQHLTVTDTDLSNHPEAFNCTDEHSLYNAFFYLNDLLHRRRVSQIADAAAYKIRSRINEENTQNTNTIRVIEIGPGPAVVAKRLETILTQHQRSQTRFTALDVNSDLLKYGLFKGLFDYAVLSDISQYSPGQLEAELGNPDVIIICEVLEHIPSSANAANQTLFEWARRSAATVIGSVPNTVQGIEIPELFNGNDAPHQLTRHLFDPTTEHVSFYCYATLMRALTQAWESKQAFIWGNGIRLDRAGTNINYDAALTFPHRSDRLCFYAEF